MAAFRCGRTVNLWHFSWKLPSNFRAVLPLGGEGRGKNSLEEKENGVPRVEERNKKERGSSSLEEEEEQEEEEKRVSQMSLRPTRPLLTAIRVKLCLACGNAAPREPRRTIIHRPGIGKSTFDRSSFAFWPRVTVFDYHTPTLDRRLSRK